MLFSIRISHSNGIQSENFTKLYKYHRCQSILTKRYYNINTYVPNAWKVLWIDLYTIIYLLGILYYIINTRDIILHGGLHKSNIKSCRLLIFRNRHKQFFLPAVLKLSKFRRHFAVVLEPNVMPLLKYYIIVLLRAQLRFTMVITIMNKW